MHKVTLLAVTLMASAALTGCSGQGRVAHSADGLPVPAAAIYPAKITGTLFSENTLKLPAASVLTITLSTVETGSSATKVLAQKVERLGGRTFPLKFELPLEKLIITAKSHAILTAAVSNNHKIFMTTQKLKPITTSLNQKQDLTLVPIANVAIKSGE